MKADDLVVGRKVQILRGKYAGQSGMIVDFDVDEDQVDVQVSGTKDVRYLGLDDVKLIDPYKSAFKNFESTQTKINKINMKKLVFESLDQLFESKKVNEESREDKKNFANIDRTKKNIEKSKSTKVEQDKREKAKQAIAALKTQLKDAKKPGAMRSTVAQKNAKIKEIEDKIKVWEKKLNESIFSGFKKNQSLVTNNDLPKDGSTINVLGHSVKIEYTGKNRDYIGFSWVDEYDDLNYEETAARSHRNLKSLINFISDEIKSQSGRSW